ncbi:unnamed protein product [Closterium sp. NIES-54]
MPRDEDDEGALSGQLNGLSVLGIGRREPPVDLPPVTSGMGTSSPVLPERVVYPFEPPCSPTAFPEHPAVILVPGGGEGSSNPSVCTPRTSPDEHAKRMRTTYTQQRLWGAPPPRNPDAPRNASPPPSSPAVKTSDADAEFALMKHRYDTDWSKRFSWLKLHNMKNGKPSLKCSVCVLFGDPNANTSYGCRGEGGRDLQLGSMRAHIGSTAHKAALKAEIDAEAAKARQASPCLGISIDESTDRVYGKHIILYATFFKETAVVTAFVTLLSVERTDAASLTSVLLQYLRQIGIDLQKIVGIATDGAFVMVGSQAGVCVRLRTEIEHLVSTHCIAHWEALAAKEAAFQLPVLNIVDDVVRGLADILGRIHMKNQRFMHLQLIFCQTNLEAQRIHAIKWLSRGEAIQRLLDVLPAAMLALKENSATLWEVVTPFKFHFLLRFLADILTSSTT